MGTLDWLNRNGSPDSTAIQVLFTQQQQQQEQQQQHPDSSSSVQSGKQGSSASLSSSQSSHSPGIDTRRTTMVAHLHPRSRSTMSLFSGCLAICFAVVTAPHILPCPVDKTQLADSAASPDGEPRRRRRRKQSAAPLDSDRSDDDDTTNINDMGRPKRECPVPKPSGLIGQVMGFKPTEQRQNPTIIIQTLRDRHNAQDTESSSDKSL